MQWNRYSAKQKSQVHSLGPKEQFDMQYVPIYPIYRFQFQEFQLISVLIENFT